MAFLELSEFSTANNPALARAAFHAEEVMEEVAEEWGIPCSASESHCYFCEIAVGLSRFCISNYGVVHKIVKVDHTETGGVTWNGDDVFYKEVARSDTLSDPIGTIENFKANSLTEEGVENICSQALNIIEETL